MAKVLVVDDEVSIRENNLYVFGRQIPVFSESEPPPWNDLGVDTVVVATGRPRNRADMERHLERGAKRVILCSPPLDAPDITVVPRVNDGALTADHRIVSNGSSSSHALALVLKILSDAVGVEWALMTTVHAVTGDQKLSDTAQAGPRWSRSAARWSATPISGRTTRPTSLDRSTRPSIGCRRPRCRITRGRARPASWAA